MDVGAVFVAEREAARAMEPREGPFDDPAIALILEDRREEGLRAVPPEAERETVTVE